MQVHCDEGVATHIGPEPCVSVREGRGEVSAGERTGQPLSRERVLSSRRCQLSGWQHGGARHRKRPDDPAWSQTLACADVPCAGTGRSPAWPAASAFRSASGRRGTEADDARSG